LCRPSKEIERRHNGTLPTPNFYDGNLRQTCQSDAVTVRAKPTRKRPPIGQFHGPEAAIGAG
jgi:hypothetical protein